jgi:hypothetical protein
MVYDPRDARGIGRREVGVGDVVEAPALTLAELARIVRAVDPTAFVIPGRVVRRAIKHDRGLPKLLIRVPHWMAFAMAGARALEVVDRDELGLGPDEPPPTTVILLAAPEPDQLAERPRAEVLRDYWRRLFHARVDVELGRQFDGGNIDRAALRERIRRVDPSAFEEARSVLLADNFLLPPRDDRVVYTEFAAVYLGLRSFADHLIPRFFPAIRDYDAVDQALAEDLDVEALLASTRLPGASESWGLSAFEQDEPTLVADPEPGQEAPSGRQYRRLLAKAEAASSRGNLVRAAILRTKASRLAGSSLAGQARSAARDAMGELATRLKAAIGFDDAALREWRKALVAPLSRSSRGFWTPEARLLSDVQKVCVDHERPFYAVDLLGWLTTFGRRPFQRLLPNHQEVLMMQHLRGASKNLASARLPEADRGRLTRLLSDAVHHAEGRLRDRFRPEIGKALEQNGFEARNLPERVALQKINEELLDRVVHRGFLSMGDLRDAVSRNNRKLPDLSGPIEFLAGDRLLCADRRLSIVMDGIYRGGEIYMRWLQRMSALAFGTRIGRLFTRYLAMPYGGAFVVLEGLQHVVGPISHILTGAEVELIDPIALAIDGTVAIGLINSPAFRRTFARYLGRLFGLLHDLIVSAPRWLLERDFVRRVLGSRAFSTIWRGLLLPLSVAGVAWALRPAYVSPSQALAASALIFLTTSLVLTTRAGRDLEEMAVDSLDRGWHTLISNLLPGLFRLVMDVFARVMEAVERVLYTVDEWLRFRGGQGRSSLASKAVLGMAWFLVAYVVRFFITLLVEPQINPIKHFPVVTVSAKILLTQVARINAVLATVLPSEQAKAVSGMILLFLPGVFGFLVWELKENWRLYEANRPRTLRPVVIGHHGETMARLLKPGFNSGTVPKIFAKLRRAERKALRTGRGKQVRKQLARLHGVEEEVRHFIDRDFLTLLLQGRSMAAMPLALGEVVPGAKRFLIELVRAGREGPGLWLSFEEHSGWLVAGVAEPGWLADLSPSARDALASALAGLYKMAGVDLVREPIEWALGPDAPSYDFREEGLVVWPDDATSSEILYLLRPEPGVPPLATIDRSGNPSIVPPPLDTDRLLFARADVAWARWVEVWERDRLGEDPPAELVEGLRLLPREPEGSGLAKESEVEGRPCP